MNKFIISEQQLENIIEAQYNYHFGSIKDVDNVAPYGSDNKHMMSGRDTGHFGSGLYFSTYKCDDHRYISDDNINTPELIQIKDGLYRVDFDLYKNLYQVKSKKQGDILFYSLKEINGLYDTIVSYIKHKYDLPQNFSERYVNTKNNLKHIGLNIPDYRKFITMCIEQVKNDDLRSMSTIIMEYNGFNGVNVSGISYYDNTLHGSVIYDISKVSNEIKQIDIDEYNCDMDRGVSNKVAGSLANIKKKLLMDKDVIGAYVSEFNKLPTNEQIYAINKYKYLLDEYTLKDLSEAARNAYFKSLPRKLRSDYLIGKVSQRHIEAIIMNGYSSIIYDQRNKIGDTTFLDYAMDKIEYTDYFDKLVDNINRPLTDKENETLNYIKNQ